MVAVSMVEERRCPFCGARNSLAYDYEQGEVVCSACGAVVHDHFVDQGPEYRAFTPEERSRVMRTGPPISIAIPDKGLATKMDRPLRSALGEPLSPETLRELERLRRWDERVKSQPSEIRNLEQALTVLKRFCEKLVLPSYVRDEAIRIYREALRKGLVRGRSIVSMVAASLYAACRKLGVPVRLKKVAEISVMAYDERGETKALENAKKEVSRCYRLLLKELRLPVKLADPSIYVRGIVERAELPSEAEEIARDVIRRAKETRIIAGKDPLGVAAAAVYVACVMLDIHKTQKEIARAAGVTEVTIRNRYKELRERLKLEIPE